MTIATGSHDQCWPLVICHSDRFATVAFLPSVLASTTLSRSRALIPRIRDKETSKSSWKGAYAEAVHCNIDMSILSRDATNTIPSGLDASLRKTVVMIGR